MNLTEVRAEIARLNHEAPATADAPISIRGTERTDEELFLLRELETALETAERAKAEGVVQYTVSTPMTAALVDSVCADVHEADTHQISCYGQSGDLALLRSGKLVAYYAPGCWTKFAIARS